MNAKRVLLAAPLLLAATAAGAADLPRRSGPPQAVDYAPPRAFAWGGFYAGVQGGYGFSAFQDSGGALVGSPSGGLIGVTGGYNYMVTPQFLVGGEVDFAFSGVGDTQTPFFGAVARGEAEDVLTVRGRAGYALIDRALVYGTAGFAASKNTIGFNTLFPLPFSGYQSSFEPGWALGAGLEYLVTQNLSAKAEYLFTSTGSGRYFDVSPYALESGVNMSSIKGGLNFHF